MLPEVNDQLSCVEIEQELLGVLINNPEFESEVRGFLFAEQFSNQANRLVYETIFQILDKGQMVSVASLNHVIASDPNCAEIISSKYIQQLADTVQTAAVLSMAGFIRELAVKRTMLQELSAAHDLLLKERASRGEEIANLISEKLFKIVQSTNKQNFVQLKEPLDTNLKHLLRLQQGKEKLLNTGFIDLDRKITGFSPSDLIILAGRPAMGKTAFALSLAANIAERSRRSSGKENGSVAIVSLEMSADQLAVRLLARAAELEAHHLRSGKFTDHEWKTKIVPASQKIADLPIFIDDSPFIPIETLAARMRRIKKQHGLSLLIVDYLQLMQSAPNQRSRNRNEEISEITRQLKVLARRLNVPVLVLSQLSRNVEYRDDKRPMLADLRDSGSIEQDADLVLFIYREEYYLEREEPTDSEEEHEKWRHKCEEARGKAEIIIGKQRQGPTGRVILGFDQRYTVFRNRISDEIFEE